MVSLTVRTQTARGRRSTCRGDAQPGWQKRKDRATASTEFAATATTQSIQAEVTMAKYGKSASKNVESAMRRRKRGTLKSGSGRRVKSRKQAIAIGLSEARKKGAKVPRKGSRRSSRKRSRSRATR
jgi:hypothetical protein